MGFLTRGYFLERFFFLKVLFHQDECALTSSTFLFRFTFEGIRRTVLSLGCKMVIIFNNYFISCATNCFTFVVFVGRSSRHNGVRRQCRAET